MNYPITQVRFLVPIAVTFDRTKTTSLPSPLPDTIFGNIDMANNEVFLNDESSLEGVNVDNLKRQILAFIQKDNQVDPATYGVSPDDTQIEQWLCNPITGERP